MMDTATIVMFLSALAGAIAGGASILTVRKAAFALRAKHRANYLLRREAMADFSVREALLEAADFDHIDEEEMQRIIEMIEKKIEILPQRDRDLIEEGLRQDSRVGARRYLQEIAA